MSSSSSSTPIWTPPTFLPDSSIESGPSKYTFLNQCFVTLEIYGVEVARKMIDINGENAGYLIGYRGEVLNSLQDIISNIVNKNSEDKIRVVLNIGNYREKRTKDLEILADKIAKSVLNTKKSITLEPMSAFERKVIHTKLQEYDELDTHSVGEEPNRKVVK